MAFCKNCGTQLNPTDTFCGNCGEPNAAAAQPQAGQYTQASVPSINTEALKAYLGQSLNAAKNILVQPISTCARVGSNLSKEAALLFGAIISILFGILSLWTVSAVTSNIKSAVTGLMGDFAGGIADAIDPSLGKVFIYSTLIFALTLAVLWGVIYATAKYILKNEINPFTVLEAVVLSAVPYCAGVLLQILISYVSFKVSIIPFAFGVILALITLYKSVSTLLTVSPDRLLYIYPVFILIMVLVAVLLTKSLGKQVFDFSMLQ